MCKNDVALIPLEENPDDWHAEISSNETRAVKALIKTILIYSM